MPKDWRKIFIYQYLKAKETYKNIGHIHFLYSPNIEKWSLWVIVWRFGKRRSETLMSENQFGFIPGELTMEPLLCVR